MHRVKRLSFCAALSLVILVQAALADDWPTFGHDGRRSAVSTENLRAPLSEDWVFTPTYPPSHAWGDPQPKPVEGNFELPRLRFDDAFHVAAVGDLIYFGSSSDTKVYALDAKTGETRWQFCTDGPVRLAPTVWQGKVYVGSDDGKVYCLDAAEGRLRWTFDAAPSAEKVLGNGKMISLWPVRTGVVVEDGVAYFGAGVFPAEGLYLYAVNAEDGKLAWKNDTYGKGGLGTVSPQGYLVASPDRLFVPSCRSMPAAFDRKDGRFLFHKNFGWRGIGLFGGTYTLLDGEFLFNGTEQILAVSVADGTMAFAEGARRLAVGKDRVYLLTGEEAVSVEREAWLSTPDQKNELSSVRRRLQKLEFEVEWRKDWLERSEKDLKDPAKTDEEKARIQKYVDQSKARLEALPAQIEKINAEMKKVTDVLAEGEKWRVPCQCIDAIALTRGLLFAGGEGVVKGYVVATGNEAWSAPVNGKARGLAVANGRLLVSTDKGSIHCFVAGGKGQGRRVQPKTVADPFPTDQTDLLAQIAQEIVSDSGVARGYGLVLGGDGRLAGELAKRTELMIYMAQPDEQKAMAARRALTSAGVYGGKVVVLCLPLDALPLPDYFANLIVCEDSFFSVEASTPVDEMLRLLKPCGGVAYVGQPPAIADAEAKSWLARRKQGVGLRAWLKDFRRQLKQTGEKETQVTTDGNWAKVARGPLNGAGSWTHQYADAANTACGDDQVVRGPMGTLWFGEPGPGRMPSRHAAAAAPLAVGGRMFVQGEDVVMAYDAYNGLRLWEREIAGAMRLGVSWRGCSNLAANDDSLFVAVGDKCLRLDAATGETRMTYPVPVAAEGKPSQWAYVACVGRLLYGGRGPVVGSRAGDCDLVFAVDLESGKLRWQYEGQEIMPNTICVGDGRLFFVDRSVTEEQKEQGLEGISHAARIDRRGKPIAPDVRLVVALDAKSGKTKWARPQYVSDCVKVSRGGGELAVMYAHNVLLLCGQALNGHFWGQFFAGEFERRSLIALAADDGRPLWSGHKGYRSRPLIVGDRIIAEPWAHDLKTGAEIMRTHPLTGATAKWQMSRPGHHCGSMGAATHALFFRSGSTAYYDLLADHGTAHFGAQRPGCWLNCIPANGVIMMPEASSGCVCPFSLHCTIVFHPRQTSRVWGMASAPEPHTPVKHLAINFGAPGDRKDSEGTLWLGYPRPRADRLVLDLDLEEELMEGGEFVRGNADFREISGTDAPWVYTSHATGMLRCTLPLLAKGEVPGLYTVRLCFAEPHDVPQGQRVFDVKLQDKVVLKDFDIVGAAPGPNRALVREFKSVEVRGHLEVELVPKSAEPTPEQAPLISAIEVLRSEWPLMKLVAGEFREPMETYNLGYWFADFVKEQAGADVALVPSDTVAAKDEPYEAGPVTLGQLFARLEDRRVVKSTVKGDELIRYFGVPEVAERLNPYCPGPDPSVNNALYYSGLDVSYEVAAQKVSHGLSPEKTYTVASLWPLKDEGVYGRERPPLDAAQKAAPVPGLTVASKNVLGKTTWDLLAAGCTAGKLEFVRRFAQPRPEWEPWKEHIEAAIAARELAEIEALAKRFAKDMTHTGGVEWRLVAFDDFKRRQVGPKWKSLRGKWQIKNGRLACSGGEIGYKQKLKAPVRIEFDGRAPKVPCDLSTFWGTARSQFRAGYFIGFGSNDNTRNKILKRGAEVIANNKPMIESRRWHHIIAQVLPDRVQLIVDGKLVLDYEEPSPVKGADMIGFYAWLAAEFANVRIYTGASK